MALHLEAHRGVLLHEVSHLLNLGHRLRQQFCLARLEENVVSDELTRLLDGTLHGRHVSLVTLVQLNGTFGNHDVFHVGGTVILVARPYCQPAGTSLDAWHVDHALAIDIELKGTLVERQGEVMPTAIVDDANILSRRVALLVRPPFSSGSYIVTVNRLLVVAHIVRDGKDFVVVPLSLVHEVYLNAGRAVLGTVVEKHVVFYGKDVAQIVLDAALDQRSNPAVAVDEGDTLLAVHRGNLGITTHKVPLRGELTHLLALHVVLEHDDAATLKVVLYSPCSGGRVSRRSVRRGSRVSGLRGVAIVLGSVHHAFHSTVNGTVNSPIDSGVHLILNRILRSPLDTAQDALCISFRDT